MFAESPVDPDPDDGAPVGPTPEEEASFQELDGGSGQDAGEAREEEEEGEPAGPLPALDELVARIPQSTRALIDELFRAKFVGVRRIPAKALKPSHARGEDEEGGAADGREASAR